MSGKTTRHMIAVYQQISAAMMFLTGFFQSPQGNFHSSEEVEIDIVRGDEDISIVVTDLSTGYRMNSTDDYTNKSFKPPIHKEAIPLNSFDLLKRMPGQNPFQSPDFRQNVITRLFNGMVRIEQKIKRSIELQASQILQTGTVTLTDSAGNALYTIDFNPKTAHFPNAGTAWDQAGADPLGDILSLANVIRGNGLADPDQLLMGEASFEEFVKNSAVIQRYETRRLDLGTISAMQMRGEGGTYRGTVEVGNYRYDIWTYGNRYKHPQTGASTKYLADDKVVVRASNGRLDATFGAIPNIGRLLGATNTVSIPELPTRISNAAGGMDMSVNVYLSEDGEQLFGGIGSRPLLIPTAIDTFGCLDTGL